MEEAVTVLVSEKDCGFHAWEYEKLDAQSETLDQTSGRNCACDYCFGARTAVELGFFTGLSCKAAAQRPLTVKRRETMTTTIQPSAGTISRRPEVKRSNLQEHDFRQPTVVGTQ